MCGRGGSYPGADDKFVILVVEMVYGQIAAVLHSDLQPWPIPLASRRHLADTIITTRTTNSIVREISLLYRENSKGANPYWFSAG